MVICSMARLRCRVMLCHVIGAFNYANAIVGRWPQAWGEGVGRSHAVCKSLAKACQEPATGEGGVNITSISSLESRASDTSGSLALLLSRQTENKEPLSLIEQSSRFCGAIAYTNFLETEYINRGHSHDITRKMSLQLVRILTAKSGLVKFTKHK